MRCTATVIVACILVAVAIIVLSLVVYWCVRIRRYAHWFSL